MNSSKKLVLVGVISSAHGVRGHVVIKSFTSPIMNIIKMSLINELHERIEPTFIRQNSKGHLICRLNDITDRSTAEKFKNHKIFCYRETLPSLEDNEFYITDLIDLVVLDSERNPIGRIKNACNFGAGDLIEIKFNDNKTELFPFTKKFVPIVTKEYIILKY